MDTTKPRLDPDNDPRQAEGASSLTVPVRPVVPDRRLATLPRLAVVGLVAGTIGLLAGLAIGGGVPPSGSTAAVPPSPSPAPTMAATPTAAPTASPVATPASLLAGMSDVAASFAPIAIARAAPRGSRCEGRDLGSTTASGPARPETQAFVHVWAIVCPAAVAADDQFPSDVAKRVMAAVGASASSWTSDGAGKVVMLVTYATQGVEGTVTIAMAPAVTGKDVELTVTLEEHALP